MTIKAVVISLALVRWAREDWVNGMLFEFVIKVSDIPHLDPSISVSVTGGSLLAWAGRNVHCSWPEVTKVVIRYFSRVKAVQCLLANAVAALACTHGGRLRHLNHEGRQVGVETGSKTNPIARPSGLKPQ